MTIKNILKTENISKYCRLGQVGLDRKALFEKR
jgi:hypothetical protein